MIKGKRRPQDWVNNDMFAMKIENTDDTYLLGKYFLFIVLKKDGWGENTRWPIFRVKVTKDDKIPTTIEELNELEYVQIDITSWEGRYGSGLGNYEAEMKKRKEREKIKFYPDEFGYLKNYQIVLGKGRKLPDNLEYVGNFELDPPKEEYVYFRELEVMYERWDYVSKTLVQCYNLYNLKKSIMYSHEKAEKLARFHREHDAILYNFLRDYEAGLIEVKDDLIRKKNSLTYVGKGKPPKKF